jgi:glucosamine--fructose-6-phosphate aminotransferase (isomerizing)
MCGIVSAISSSRNVVPILIDGLKQLEYRGYDSAGIAVINGKLHRIRSPGRVADLELRIAAGDLAGGVGIGHTRWATHGEPSERNAHPHVSGGISVVHNGIIENHEVIRSRLRGMGYEFSSDTDTEVIAHLIHSMLDEEASLLAAVRRCLTELSGAYAIAVISDADANRMVVARKGAPLLLGLGQGENYAASDSAALAAVTRQIIYLEDGDCAELTPLAVQVLNAAGDHVQRTVNTLQLSVQEVGMGNYRHYMQKEIFQQPTAIADTIAELVSGRGLTPEIFGEQAGQLLTQTDSVLILACGTSYHAAMVARYWIESVAGIACNVEIASEYRYRDVITRPQTLVIAISQSGETADTLAALSAARERGHRTSLCICNVAESSLMRAADLCFLTRAGPEIGVASTKAFTTQLAALAMFTLVMARLFKRLSPASELKYMYQLSGLPDALTCMLAVEDEIREWARTLTHVEHALFLGRGIHYPIAMEGALKLKEISYIHAEAYAAGELKHGPLALVNREMPVIAIAPGDALIEKLKSNLKEVQARGGELYILADHDTQLEESPGIHLIRTPNRAGLLSPILHTIPLQLLAYHAAVNRGNDVDKPRNLAKSVTVE